MSVHRVNTYSMGKTQSTQRAAAPPSSQGVKMRNKPPKKASTLERPVSLLTTGTTTAQFSMSSDASKSRNKLPRSDSAVATNNLSEITVNLSAKSAHVIKSDQIKQEFQQSSVSSKVSSTDNNESRNRIPKEYQHPDSHLAQYRRSLDQVTLIWPEFITLNAVDPMYLEPEVLSSVCELLRRLVEQYQRIRVLHDGTLETEEHLQQLKNKFKETETELASRQTEINELKSASEKKSTQHGFAELDSLTERSGIPAVDYDLETTHNDVDQDSGFSSPRQTYANKNNDNPQSPSSTERVKLLECELAQERNENTILRARHSTALVDDATVKPRAQETSQLVERYQRLEEDAIGKLFSIIKSATPSSVTDERRRMFICAVMETAYAVALTTTVRFTDVIRNVLSNPAKLASDLRAHELIPSSPYGLVPSDNSDIDSTYDALKNDQESSRQPMTDSIKSLTDRCGNISTDTLVCRIKSHLADQSDVIDLSILTDAVVDVLIRLYPDCAVPALINHSPSFSRFINECCRVAWKLVVADPPYYVATVIDASAGCYDNRLHTTLMQEPSDQAVIDHYLWPVLFDHRHGPVIFQGRVLLKQLTNYIM